MTIYISF